MNSESLRNMRANFFDTALNFPNVIALVDGTQIPIKAPSTDEHLYVGYAGKVTTPSMYRLSAMLALKLQIL